MRGRLDQIKNGAGTDQQDTNCKVHDFWEKKDQDGMRLKTTPKTEDVASYLQYH
jgi:hypothetical protein